MRGIQAYHMGSEGMCDIAYNYVVSRDGRIWMGRGATREGGHTYGENSGNVGISFMGNYTSMKPTNDQEWMTAHLLRRLHSKHPEIRLNRDDIKGHRQHGAAGGGTACPGNSLYNRIGEIVEKAKKL